MKKNKTFILLAVLLVILIGGAGFFYNKLSSSYKTAPLTQASQTTENEAKSDKKNSEEDSQPEENNKKAEIEEDAQTSDKEESAASPTDSEDTEDSHTEDSHTDSSENTDSGETTVETAPDFTMTNASGEEVKLSDFFGKPVVLNFWASSVSYTHLPLLVSTPGLHQFVFSFPTEQPGGLLTALKYPSPALFPPLLLNSHILSGLHLLHLSPFHQAHLR